jgi:hypothetical protein
MLSRATNLLKFNSFIRQTFKNISITKQIQTDENVAAAAAAATATATGVSAAATTSTEAKKVDSEKSESSTKYQAESKFAKKPAGKNIYQNRNEQKNQRYSAENQPQRQTSSSYKGGRIGGGAEGAGRSGGIGMGGDNFKFVPDRSKNVINSHNNDSMATTQRKNINQLNVNVRDEK